MAAELGFKVQLKILKPVAEVFDAVVNPKKLSGYFVKTASGPLEKGQVVRWAFPEKDLENMPFPVDVIDVQPPERIVLAWEGDDGATGQEVADAKAAGTTPAYKTRVEMVFTPLGPNATMVQISESGWRDTPKGRESSHGNAAGWMHMMTCMKAYLEYGINLRAGGVF